MAPRFPALKWGLRGERFGEIEEDKLSFAYEHIQMSASQLAL